MAIKWKLDPEHNLSYISEKIESRAIYVDFEDETLEFITSKPLKVCRLMEILEEYPEVKKKYYREREMLKDE